MFFGLLTLATALAISVVAAYYSIVGLMAIFAGATTAIVVMGAVLEVGKLICASWTFTNWKTSPIIMKSYFISAIIILMLITSLGIFGFLSRAHITQSSPTALLESRIQRIELKVEQRQKEIGRHQSRLDILDKAFERYIELGAVSKGLQKIGEMENETNLLKTKIQGLEKEIDKLKRPQSKETKTKEMREFVGFFKKHLKDISNIFEMQNLLIDAKMLIVRKLEKIKGMTKTFIKTDIKKSRKLRCEF